MKQNLKLPKRELESLVNLLSDSEDKTLLLIAEQVNSFGPESLQLLDELAQSSKNDVLIDNWYFVSRLSLSARFREWKKNRDLETGLFLISRIRNPGIDEDKYRKTLDNYAERVMARTSVDADDKQLIKEMNRVLFLEENYIGNQIAYYDLNNNFLYSVMDTKTGNPIMLSCVYILVGRRLGLNIQGVGTPGHFVTSFEGELLDPFFGGREVTKDECVIRAQELSVFWREEYLDPIDDISIVARCIRNLIAIYKKQNNLEKAADASELLRLV